MSTHRQMTLAGRSLAFRQHVAQFGGEWRYKEWCQRHGFDANLDKDKAACAREIACLQAEQARIKDNMRLHHNPPRLIEDICLNRLTAGDIIRPKWKAFAETLAKSGMGEERRNALLALCLHVWREGDFLLDETEVRGVMVSYLTALIAISGHTRQWLRPVEDWRPKTSNGLRQFRSLLHHLFARYPLPEFFDQAWFSGNQQHCSWYIHTGTGGNMRTAQTPLPLTKLMAHHMMQAPGTCTIEEALRWGQVLGLGGSEELAKAILGSRIATAFHENDFWASVIRWLVNNPSMPMSQIAPLIDYLYHQRFEPRRILDADGTVHDFGPEQPNLTLTGRTTRSLLQGMDRWHSDLGKTSRLAGEIFPPSGRDGIRLQVRSSEVWVIRELRTTAELREEGRSMRHCVLTYARTCAAGRDSIWAMEWHSPQGIEKHQTIQLTREGVIVQCRGKANRLPTTAEFAVLTRWAKARNLAIAPHVSAAA